MSGTPRTDALRDSSGYPTPRGELWQFAATLERELAAVTAERDALRARVDTLMLEFCPDEMTAEQVLRWETSQTRSAK